MSAGTRATVLHDIAPTYEEEVRSDIVVRPVATFDIPLDMSDDEALNLFFRATNSVHAAWFEVCRRSFNVVALEKSRSTSVGDVIAIERNGTTTHHLCCSVGWKRICSSRVRLESKNASLS